MTIIISGKPAMLKRNSSFEYVSENRFFTGADSYTLSITFPLRGCRQNIEIFGHINRKDCDLDRLLLDCEIHDRNFHAYGSISIVEISEVEVKTQFFEGRSAPNFYSDLDDTYINEISMPSLHFEARFSLEYHCRTYRVQKTDDERGEGSYQGYVGLPWVNNTSGNIQNRVRLNDNSTKFVYESGGFPDIVGQPFLLEILKQVLSGCGYSYNIYNIEQSQWANVIVCNAFPHSWGMGAMNLILPHWTVSEFLDQLEMFYGGQFNIEKGTKHVTFAFNKNLLEGAEEVVLNNVIDTHQVEIADEKDAKDTYIEQRNMAYADCSHHFWKFYCCPWATKGILSRRTWVDYNSMFNGLSSYLGIYGTTQTAYLGYLHYCLNEDTYFVLRCVGTNKVNNSIARILRLQPVNVFGPSIVNTKEGAETSELRIVPACIDWADQGDYIFIDCGTLGDDDATDEDVNEYETKAVKALKAGEREKKEEYFDKLYVAYWDGNVQGYYPFAPHPVVDKYEVTNMSVLRTFSFSMRLGGKHVPSTKSNRFRIDQTKKFTFSFLSDTIPDVRSVFFIHGKKYLAEKITCSFSENGMSRLLKMVAYRVT